MNCTSWGQYETPGSSETAALCHGGHWEGEDWSPCPARDSCRQETLTQVRPSSHRPTNLIGVQNLTRNPTGGSRILGSTPSKQMGRPIPRTMPAAAQPRSAVERPVHPAKEDESNPYLSTPYVPGHGDVMPTFLPQGEENVFARLGKNLVQGMLGNGGLQVHRMTQHVDFFPFRKKK